MSVYRSQIQNMFLSAARKKHIPVEVVLNTGTSLRGKVKGYDQFSVTLMFKDKLEVIYKSSILFITLLMKRLSPPPSRPSGGFRGRPAPAPIPTPAPPQPEKMRIFEDEPVVRKPPRVFDPEESDPPPPRKAPVRKP